MKDEDIESIIISHEKELRSIQDDLMRNYGFPVHKVDKCWFDGIRNNFPKSSRSGDVYLLDYRKISDSFEDIGSLTWYQVEYIKYQYPYLKVLIDRLLDYDFSAYQEILSCDLSKERTSIDDRISCLEQQLECEQQVRVVQDLRSQISTLKIQKELQKNQEDISVYYDKIKTLIGVKDVENNKVFQKLKR